MNEKRLIAILGPTAVGKTDTAVRVAEYYHTEIISADSRQLYTELEIGTAKPTPQILSRVKHHFINTKAVVEAFDAGEFGEQARAVLRTLFKSHDQVVICGGSGLYVKAVLEGFNDLPQVPTELRMGIVEEFDKKGIGWLQREVETLDPDYFEVVDRQNPQRLMRALEVIRTTRKTFSGFHKKEKISLPFGVIKIGLELKREELYDRIDKRMDGMIEKGLFEEAKRFFPLRHLNALQTVGYQEIFGFLEGSYSQEEAIRLLKRNSRRYAKRQLTWFKKDKEIHWFRPEDWDGIMNFIKKKSIQ